MKKRLVIRKPRLTLARVLNGPHKNKLVYLMKRGFSGWHCKFKDTLKEVYVFNHELYA